MIDGSGFIRLMEFNFRDYRVHRVATWDVPPKLTVLNRDYNRGLSSLFVQYLGGLKVSLWEYKGIILPTLQLSIKESLHSSTHLPRAHGMAWAPGRKTPTSACRRCWGLAPQGFRV